MVEIDPKTDETPKPWLKSYPTDVSWEYTVQQRPLFDLLDDAVSRFADRPCVDFMGRRVTYRQMGALTERLAGGLQSIGVRPGTKVGLFLPNCPTFVMAYFAVLKCGGVVVNYNPLYVGREIAHQIDDSDTEIMITLDLNLLYEKLAPLVRTTKLKTIIVDRMAPLLPFPKNLLYPLAKRADIATIPNDGNHFWMESLLAKKGAFRPVEVDPNQTAVLQYTGGTTGVPKGAMLSHNNLYNNAVQSALWFNKCRPGQERILAALPFFHVFAMTTIMNFGLYYGAEMILVPRFELDPVMEIIDKKKPTLFPAVPTIYMAIANHQNLSKYSVDSIKYCISGGAPLPLDVRNAFIKATGCQLVEGYGLTEASPVCTCNLLAGENKENSIGLPLPGTSIEIVSLKDPEKILPPGEKGELCFRGPQIMQGYYNRPEETADVLNDGRLRTGDVGYVDEDGHIFIVDRIKDLIIAGGYNIYPRVIEEAIYLHRTVAECIVAGIPDAYRGETVKAFVKLKDGESLSELELVEFLRDKLSPMEMPKRIEFRQELPKTMIGKLDRKTIREEEVAKQSELNQPTAS